MIDTSFDFRTDTPPGKDPDAFSPTLRTYHRQLWSKPLPSGAPFVLVDTTPGVYLHHRSEVGEFFLSSDAVIATFTRWVSMQPIVSQLSEADAEAFRTAGYTIGGMLVFPGNRVEGMQTINGARGFTRAISDRLDLTLECIRRHYRSEASPLDATLQRYADFFALFVDFRGYVDFFLLQDLVSDDDAVRFLMPFDNFTTPAVPPDLATYHDYRRRSMEFVAARNLRIGQWENQCLPTRGEP